MLPIVLFLEVPVFTDPHVKSIQVPLRCNHDDRNGLVTAKRHPDSSGSAMWRIAEMNLGCGLDAFTTPAGQKRIEKTMDSISRSMELNVPGHLLTQPRYTLVKCLVEGHALILHPAFQWKLLRSMLVNPVGG